MRLNFLLPQPEPAPGFNAYQSRLFLAQKRRQPIAEIAIAVLFFLVLRRATSTPTAAAWLTLSLCVQTLYFFLPRWLVDRSCIPARFRLEDVPPYSLLNGLTVAAPLLFFGDMEPLDLTLLTSIYVGLLAGSLATTATFRPVFLAYSLPFLLPLPLIWLLAPGFDDRWVQRVMALILAIFAFAIVRISDDMRDALRASYVIRHEKEELNHELKRALEAAEAANRAKTRFLASASHDLRQPIQTVSLFAAALALRPLDERSRSIVTNLNQALVDLGSELDALLDISKLDAGVVVAQPSATRLKATLDRIDGMFRTSAEAKGLDFVVSCPDGVAVYVDRSHLERVLRNLVENAIKYTTSGRVQVSATTQDSGCMVTVSDTGCGISPEEQTRVFDEFYQVDNPQRDRRRGLGLGLAIVRRLTSLQQIDLRLESTPGEGTQFSLLLPLGNFAPNDCTAPLADVTSARTSALHVLAIDDEESVRNSLQVLAEELGWSLDLGASTADALLAAQRRRPDVLLSDFRLSGAEDGISLIRSVRELYPDLPALLVSGDSAPDRIAMARDADIPMVHKPIAADALVAQVNRLAKIDPGAMTSSRNNA